MEEENEEEEEEVQVGFAAMIEILLELGGDARVLY